MDLRLNEDVVSSIVLEPFPRVLHGASHFLLLVPPGVALGGVDEPVTPLDRRLDVLVRNAGRAPETDHGDDDSVRKIERGHPGIARRLLVGVSCRPGETSAQAQQNDKGAKEPHGHGHSAVSG